MSKPRAREIVPGTAIAAIPLSEATNNIRVYVQDSSGGIREFSYRPPDWSGGSAYHVLFQSKDQSSVTSAEWYDRKKEIHIICIYSFDKENKIIESRYNGSEWTAGDLSLYGFQGAPSSEISTISLDSSARIYYQVIDEKESINDIQELIYNGSDWSKGGVLPKLPEMQPLQGTALTSVGWDDSQIRVYFQSETYEILEASYNGVWSISSIGLVAKPYSPLAAVSWPDAGRRIRLYYLNVANLLQEYCNDGGGEWVPGSLNNYNVQSAPFSKLSAIYWDSRIRLYFQPADPDSIKEWWTNFGSTDWAEGASLRSTPPGSKPIDYNGETYPVGFLPYIGDLKSWRSYDPASIDGVGILVGYFNGRLIGEDLKNQQSVILAPNTDGNSYTWVYTPGGAIFYRLWDRDHRADYVRHSQLGSGEPVKCAGEFRIAQEGYLDTVLVMINDASGHYKPKGSQCLGPVAAKLESLEISLNKTQWYFNE